MSDNINHPAHYNVGGIECIDVIESAMGQQGAQAFCIGNAIKYIYRHRYKGSAREDIEKAIWYLNKWLELDGRDGNENSSELDAGFLAALGHIGMNESEETE